MTVFYRMMRIKFFYSRDAFFLQLRDVQIEKCFTTLPGAKRGRGIKWKKVNLSVNDIFPVVISIGINCVSKVTAAEQIDMHDL